MGLGVGIKSGATPFLASSIIDLANNRGRNGSAGPFEAGESFYNSTGGTLNPGDILYKRVSSAYDATYGVKVAKANPATSGAPVQYVCLETVANGSTGAMAERALVKTSLDASASSVGAPVYWSGSALTLTQATNLPVVAVVATATTNAVLNFDVPAMSQTSAGSAFTFVQATVSSNITNTTTETVFDQGVTTIPASMIALGRPLRVKIQGRTPTTNGADTLTIKLLLGGTTTNTSGAALVTIPATDVADNDTFHIDFTLVPRAAPSATTACVGFGTFTIGAPGTATMKPTVFGPTNLATSNALPIKVSATWSAASASDIVRLDNFIVSVSADPV